MLENVLLGLDSAIVDSDDVLIESLPGDKFAHAHGSHCLVECVTSEEGLVLTTGGHLLVHIASTLGS